MKVKLLFFFLVFVFQFSYSQTEKLFHAKVFCEDLPLQGIEVLNLASKKTTITDSNGRFSILVKAKDTLMFISKNYEYKRRTIKNEDLNKENLIILLIRKPEELEEVVVVRKIAFPKIKFDKNIASQLNIEKAAKNPKPYGVYDGTIENGIGMYINISSSRKKKPEIEFKKVATSTCNQDYFNKTLHIKPEEVALFLEFCDADPKSKIVLENTNPLKLMDFWFAKNIEFKKLSTLEK
jgi:hypothetical protein